VGEAAPVPVSRAQYEAARARRLPDFEQVTESTWSLSLPVSDELYTLSYLLEDGDGGLVLIDPGLDRDANWDLLCAALERLGRSPDVIGTIVVTHMHPDHLGMAERLRRTVGSQIVMHRAEQSDLRTYRPLGTEEELDAWGVPERPRSLLREIRDQLPPYRRIEADLLVDDGDRLPMPGRSLDVIWTPGHTDGSICLRDASTGLLFTGDHVLPTINSGLGLGGRGRTDPVGDFLTSLDRLVEFDGDEVCPGHEYRFRGVAARCEQLARHHRRRSAEVADALAGAGSASVWQVAERVTWTSGFDGLHGFRLLSAVAQTAMHVEHLRYTSVPADRPRQS
jgi:glyoxylase-like metal-dependent hydrolase (beta-lactamase superfamily II)